MGSQGLAGIPPVGAVERALHSKPAVRHAEPYHCISSPRLKVTWKEVAPESALEQTSPRPKTAISSPWFGRDAGWLLGIFRAEISRGDRAPASGPPSPALSVASVFTGRRPGRRPGGSGGPWFLPDSELGEQEEGRAFAYSELRTLGDRTHSLLFWVN